MPPKLYSRYTFCKGYKDSSNSLVLTEPIRYTFKKFPDNRYHVVCSGDTLYKISAKYFKGFYRPEGLWWIIADFQPNPIVDPTIKLEAGSVLIIPSNRTIIEEIFSNRRYLE